MRRIVDFITCLILISILSPLFIIISFIVTLTSEGPAFFKQRRIGKDNHEFILYKFRTMKVGTPNVATDKFKDSASFITTFGKILRRTSMDELPQLINILKGEMTFIGPRPALYNQYQLKELRTQSGVHTLVPALTGWAQVNGRDTVDDLNKARFDEYYLLNKSLKLDLVILFRTVFTVLRAQDILENSKKVGTEKQQME